MEKKLILPETQKLHDDFLVNYGNKILELNNLKVGDEIETEFEYEVIKTRYKSREMDRFTFKKTANGVLKLDEKGRLYAESLELMPFYTFVTEGRKRYYKQEMKKSILRFGTGFVY